MWHFVIGFVIGIIIGIVMCCVDIEIDDDYGNPLDHWRNKK